MADASGGASGSAAQPAPGACSSSAAKPGSHKRTLDTEPSDGASGCAARPAMTVSSPSSPAEPDADESTQEMGPVLGPKATHEQVLQEAGIASPYNQTTAGKPVWFKGEPVSPWHWGCRCKRGPHWDKAGNTDQDGGPGSLGVVLPPDPDDLHEWLLGVLYGCHGGLYKDGLYDGGWWWDRSVKCCWRGDIENGIYYYRAGDCGAWDLCTAEPWVPDPHEFMFKVWKVRDAIYKLLDKAAVGQLDMGAYEAYMTAVHEPRKQPEIVNFLRKSTAAYADLIIFKMFDLQSLHEVVHPFFRGNPGLSYGDDDEGSSSSSVVLAKPKKSIRKVKKNT